MTMYKAISALLMGTGYGVAWFAALTNSYVVIMRLGAGEPTESFLPIALAGWAIILWIHYRNRWFPFNRR